MQLCCLSHMASDARTSLMGAARVSLPSIDQTVTELTMHRSYSAPVDFELYTRRRTEYDRVCSAEYYMSCKETLKFVSMMTLCHCFHVAQYMQTHNYIR